MNGYPPPVGPDACASACASTFGSKASYRGDKLTRRVWDEIAGGIYVAQQIVAPSECHIASQSGPLKLNIRCYAYRGEVLLYAARMYQGQTTNFRTPGGGFAPVLTTRDERHVCLPEASWMSRQSPRG